MNEKQALRRAIDARLSGLSVSGRQQLDLLRLAEKGEQPVKKKISLSLVLALALLALAATACAAAVRYGMLDDKPLQSGNPAYLNQILTLDETYENEHMFLSVNDAAFDGEHLSLTLDVRPKEGGRNLFIYPQLTASSGGAACAADFCGSRGGSFSEGFFCRKDGGVSYGADYALREKADGPVTWTLTLDILDPLYPVEPNPLSIAADDDPHPDEDAVSDEDYMESFAQGCRDGKIYLSEPLQSMDLFERNLPRPQQLTEEAWNGMPMPERLAACGAFAPVDRLTVVFTTEDAGTLTCDLPQTFPLGDDYEVTLTSLSATSSQVKYELDVQKKAGHGKSAAQEWLDNDGCWEFALLIPDGQTLPCADAAGADAASGSVLLNGMFEVSRRPDELIFVPCWNPVSQNAEHCPYHDVLRAQRPLTEAQEQLMFRVKLRPDIEG